MERYYYPLDHYCAGAGQIGRLLTLSAVPVIANDSISVDFVGSIRMSPLRRALTLDAKVELFTFFVPYRHVYDGEGSNDLWTDWVKDAVNDDTDTLTFASTVGWDPLDDVGYIPVGILGTRGVSLHMIKGYAQIFNEYFWIPNTTIAGYQMAEETWPSDSDVLRYGQPCGKIPTMLTTNPRYVTADSYGDVSVDVGTPGSEHLSLMDFQKARQILKSNIQRDYFAERYRDVVSTVFGSTPVNPDADQRPTLCAHSVSWMSGYDVDGTDDAALGQYSGKSQAMVRHQMPMKYFNEHGTLWTMALVRFPPIFNNEVHPVNSHQPANGTLKPNYDVVAADPEVIKANRPVLVNDCDFISYSPDNGRSMGYMPYGQWYREHHNHVHPVFKDRVGFPFIERTGVSGSEVYAKMAYEEPSKYNDMFQSTELGHWHMVGKMNMDSKRIVPPASESVFSGSEEN